MSRLGRIKKVFGSSTESRNNGGLQISEPYSNKENVLVAVTKALDESPAPVVAFGEINEKAELSHQTVNKYLKELQSDSKSQLRHESVGGMTVYWVDGGCGKE